MNLHFSEEEYADFSSALNNIVSTLENLSDRLNSIECNFAYQMNPADMQKKMARDGARIQQRAQTLGSAMRLGQAKSNGNTITVKQQNVRPIGSNAIKTMPAR